MALEDTAHILATRRRVTVAEIIHLAPGFDVRKDVSRLLRMGWEIRKEYNATRNGEATYSLVSVGRTDFKNPKYDWSAYAWRPPVPFAGVQESLF